MTETILIVISHIEDRILLTLSIDYFFKILDPNFFMVLLNLSGCYFFPECDNLISDLHTHTRKLVIRNTGRFSIDIGDIFEVF